MQILRADQSPTHGEDDFRIRRVRPGTIRGPGADLALGPLAAFDHAELKQGKVVKMHEHRNDEILTYVWRGTMLHEDSAGHRVPISAAKLMVMNAGEGFRHEESVPDEPVEALQIFVRPREADLPATVAFHDRPASVPAGRWDWIAGPEGSGAPLIMRNEVRIYDAHLRDRQQVAVPMVAGMRSFLYVVEGVVEIGGERLGRGDAVCDMTLPSVAAASDASLVLFLVDETAPGSRAGTISGH